MESKSKVRLAAALLAVTFVAVAVRAQVPDNAADTARLAEVLELRDGSVVADIGAGAGPLTVLIAPHVGPKGRVFSTDINPERLREIREAVTIARLQNVTVVEGGSSRTGLSDECCDAMFMRDVYHHFAEPADMNASLLRSLKPGGRLAVIDFPPRGGRTAPAGARDQGVAHGILPADLIRELVAAGFAEVREADGPSPGYFLVVARKPAARGN